MIRAILYDPADGRLRDGGIEVIDAWERTPTATIWLVLENEPRKTEAKILSKRFGIHQLALTDAP